VVPQSKQQFVEEGKIFCFMPNKMHGTYIWWTLQWTDYILQRKNNSWQRKGGDIGLQNLNVNFFAERTKRIFQ